MELAINTNNGLAMPCEMEERNAWKIHRVKERFLRGVGRYNVTCSTPTVDMLESRKRNMLCAGAFKNTITCFENCSTI